MSTLLVFIYFAFPVIQYCINIIVYVNLKKCSCFMIFTYVIITLGNHVNQWNFLYIGMFVIVFLIAVILGCLLLQ